MIAEISSSCHKLRPGDILLCDYSTDALAGDGHLGRFHFGAVTFPAQVFVHTYPRFSWICTCECRVPLPAPLVNSAALVLTVAAHFTPVMYKGSRLSTPSSTLDVARFSVITVLAPMG